jgi:hypothetical protein
MRLLPPLSGSVSKAKIGSTVTAQLVASKITDYALILFIVGFGLMLLFKVIAGNMGGEPQIGRLREIFEDE